MFWGKIKHAIIVTNDNAHLIGSVISVCYFICMIYLLNPDISISNYYSLSNSNNVQLLIYVTASYVLCAALSLPMLLDIIINLCIKGQFDLNSFKYLYFSQQFLILNGLLIPCLIYFFLASLCENEVYVHSVSIYLVSARSMWIWGLTCSLYIPGSSTLVLESRPKPGDPLRLKCMLISYLSQGLSGCCQYDRFVNAGRTEWLYFATGLITVLRLGVLIKLTTGSFYDFWKNARTQSEHYYAFMSYVICPSFLVQVIYCEIIYPKYYEGFALYAVSVVTINVFMAIFTVTVVIYPVRMTSVWVEFNRMATEKLEREKQSYIGYISHEMRTPLNISNIGISLLTRSLERNGDMKPELKDITDTMHQSLMAATTTLDDLMIFQYVDSKISDKAMTYEDPVNLVKDCLEFQIVNYPQLSNRIQFVCSNNMITNLECTRKLWTNKPLFNKMIGYVISFASTAIPDDGIIIVQLSIDSRISNDEESGYDAFSHANPRMYVDWLKIIISHPTFAQVSARYRKLIPDSISLDAELDGRSEPTALGLFLSRKIVKLFKGKLECIEISKEEVCLHKIRIPLESISSCNLIHQNVSEDAFREDIKPDLKADVTSIRLSPKSLDSLSSKWTFSKNDGSVFFDEAGHVGVDDKMDTFLPTDQIKLTLLEDSRHSMTVTCRRMIKKLINSQKPESRSSLRCVDLKTELQSDDSLTILQNKFDTDQSYQVIKKLNDIKLESTSYCNSCDSSPKTLKVLVADDSRPCLKMTVRIFSKLYNADCVEVMNGADAVRAIEKSFDYDLILLDNKMPVMNGYEACREIRKLGYDKPIFGITGHVSIEDMENFSESGATHIFTKPLDMQEFILYLKDIQYIPFAPKASN